MRSVQAEALAAILERRQESATRFIDLAITLVASSGEPLLAVGGRWDTLERRYDGPAETGRVIRLQPAQDEVGQGLAEWWQRYVTGDWRGAERIYDWIWRSGRGGGKSWIGSAACVIHAVACPGSIVWAVAAKDDELDELTHQGIEPHILRGWARFNAANEEFLFCNGSIVRMLSGYKPENLKQGRVDFCFLNEAQKMRHKSWANVRGRIADRGGLCVLAMNPPDTAGGQWVRKLEEQASPETGLRATYLDASLNDKRDNESMAMFARLLDEKTKRRELDGEYVPLGDTVIYAWSDDHNVIDIPDDWTDITALFCRSWFGVAADTILGNDFDRVPHCAAAIQRIYQAPGVEYPLVVQIEEALGEEGEDSLIAALDELPGLDLPGAPGREALLDPKRTLCVADASNRTQEAGKHVRGASSWRYLERAGYRPICAQWPLQKKNPSVRDRYSLQNLLCKASTGERRYFIRRGVDWSIEAHREYPIHNNKPKRWDVHAHMVDANGYPLWALFGRDVRAIDWLPGKAKGASAGKRYSTDAKQRNTWGASRAEALGSVKSWGRK